MRNIFYCTYRLTNINIENKYILLLAIYYNLCISMIYKYYIINNNIIIFL